MVVGFPKSLKGRRRSKYIYSNGNRYKIIYTLGGIPDGIVKAFRRKKRKR